MNFQNISNEIYGTIYAGFMEWDNFKLLYLIFHICLTFVAPLILYSIVWYERHGSDLQYRTVTHIVLSHICLISIAKCLTARIPYVAILFISPLSPNKCDLIILIGRHSFLCSFNEILIWQLTKYFYIFKWRHLVSLNDEFSAIFLTMCNLLLSAVFLIATYMSGYHNAELDYHICTGRSPRVNIVNSFRYKLKQGIFPKISHPPNFFCWTLVSVG
jgi:hypothetical protein